MQYTSYIRTKIDYNYIKKILEQQSKGCTTIEPFNYNGHWKQHTVQYRIYEFGNNLYHLTPT